MNDYGDHIRDVHQHDRIAAPYLQAGDYFIIYKGFFIIIVMIHYLNPEVEDGDQAADDSYEAVEHIHGRANVHIQHIYVEILWHFILFSKQNNSRVSYDHVEGVTEEVNQDDFELDAEEGQDDLYHAYNGYQGSCDLRNTA